MPGAVLTAEPALEQRGGPGTVSRCIAFVCAFTIFLAFAIAVQLVAGSYRSELAHQADEPAHVMTAMLAHDYLASGIGRPPMAYAEQYYLHYPKISIGMWPPVFYGIAGLWLQIAPVGSKSLLVLIAVTSAILATALAAAVYRAWGILPALAAGFLLLSINEFQQATAAVMLDAPVAMLSFFAILALAAYFREERMSYAVLFGAVAAAAMLTKANANALVFAPLLMIPLTGRYALLRKPDLYVAGAIVAVIGIPWQLFSLRMLQSSVPISRVDAAYCWRMLLGYGQILFRQFGPFLLLSAVGAWTLCRHRRTAERACAEGLAIGSLAAATILFHLFMPVPGPEERYMCVAFAPIIYLSFIGLRAASSWRGIRKFRWAPAAIGAGFILAAGVTGVFASPRLTPLGFAQAARQVTRMPGVPRILVCSDTRGEGAFITEVAFLDRRPEHVVLRATKVISDNPWTSKVYKPRFPDAGALASFLLSAPVNAIVIDQSEANWMQDRALLMEAIRRSADRWTLVYDGRPAHTRRIQIYVLRDGNNLTPRRLEIDLKFTLGRTLKFENRKGDPPNGK